MYGHCTRVLKRRILQVLEVVESILFPLEALKGMWHVFPVEVPEVMRSTESISTGGCALSHVLEGMRCVPLHVPETVEVVLCFARDVETECQKVRLCVGEMVRLGVNNLAKVGGCGQFCIKIKPESKSY